MGKEAVSINANTIQFFTRNPRGGAAKEIDEEDVKKFKELAKQTCFYDIISMYQSDLNKKQEVNIMITFIALFYGCYCILAMFLDAIVLSSPKATPPI